MFTERASCKDENAFERFECLLYHCLQKFVKLCSQFDKYPSRLVWLKYDEPRVYKIANCTATQLTRCKFLRLERFKMIGIVHYPVDLENAGKLWKIYFIKSKIFQ